MIFVLPDWYGEAQKKLDDCLDDIIRKNNIDWTFAHDSDAIKEAKNTILMKLFVIYEKVGIEERKMMEEFEKGQAKLNKEMEKDKNRKSHKKSIKKKNGKGSPNKNKN